MDPKTPTSSKQLSVIIPSLFLPSAFDPLSRCLSQFDLSPDLTACVDVVVVGPPKHKLSNHIFEKIRILEYRYPSLRCLYGAESIYDAMNLGIVSSSSRFLYFSGDTDLPYLSSLLSCIASSLKTPPAPVPLTIILGRCVSSSGTYSPTFFGFSPLGLAFERNPIHHQAVIYSKSLFDFFGLYDSSYKLLADYHFNLKLRAYYFNSSKPTLVPLNVTHTTSLFGFFQEGGASSKPRLLNYSELARAKSFFLHPLLVCFAYIFSFLIYTLKNFRQLL